MPTMPRKKNKTAYVWVCPGRQSGEPCIGDHRIPVDMVVELAWDGGVKSAMWTWNLTRGEVLVACWYAAEINVVRLGQRRRGPWQARWGEWAQDAQGALWKADYDAVPDPPTKDGQ
jgi:uncharacterized protein (DUF433 family)